MDRTSYRTVAEFHGHVCDMFVISALQDVTTQMPPNIPLQYVAMDFWPSGTRNPNVNGNGLAGTICGEMVVGPREYGRSRRLGVHDGASICRASRFLWMTDDTSRRFALSSFASPLHLVPPGLRRVRRWKVLHASPLAQLPASQWTDGVVAPPR